MSVGDHPITVTCDGKNYTTVMWPHQVATGDTVLINNTCYAVTDNGGTMATTNTAYHGYPTIGYAAPGTTAGSFTIRGGGSGTTPVYIMPGAEFLPNKEATAFLTSLIKEHCSENDIKEILLILFNKLSTTEKEDIRISPEVVTSLLAFCIEKYA